MRNRHELHRGTQIIGTQRVEHPIEISANLVASLHQARCGHRQFDSTSRRLDGLEKGTMSVNDYNYPIVQFYEYEQPAYLRGAEVKGRMQVEYALNARVEFIPQGCDRGRVCEIYFKILKALQYLTSKSLNLLLLSLHPVTKRT